MSTIVRYKMSYRNWSEIFQEEQLTDYSTTRYEEDFYTTATFDTTGVTNPIVESRIVSKENFVLPSEAYLLVNYQLLKQADGTPFEATDNIALVNNWALFSKVELMYNGVNIETVDNPGMVAQTLGLLEDPKDYESKGSLEYRYYDTVKNGKYVEQGDGTITNGVYDGIIPGPPPTRINIADDAATLAADIKKILNQQFLPALTDDVNEGQVQRLKRAPADNTDNWIKLRLKDVFGICKVAKPVRGIQIQVRLTLENNWNRALLRGPVKANPTNDVQRGLTDKGVAIVKRISLYMPSLKAHYEAFNMINEKLNSKEPIPFDFQKVWSDIKRDAVGGAGTIDYSVRLLSNTKRPRHVFIGIQNSQRHKPTIDANGQLLNPMIFDLPTAVSGNVQIGNERYPALDYNSAQDGFVRMYNAFLNSTGKNADALASSFLDFNRWKDLYSIMYFDCSHADNQYELSMDSEIVVNLKLTGAPALFNVFAIVVSDEHWEIEEDGNVVRISRKDKAGIKF